MFVGVVEYQVGAGGKAAEVDFSYLCAKDRSLFVHHPAPVFHAYLQHVGRLRAVAGQQHGPDQEAAGGQCAADIVERPG